MLVESPAELANALDNREPNGPLLIEIDAAAWQKNLMSPGDNNEE